MYKKTAYAPRKCYLDYTDERLWERGYLKAKCKELCLEEEYKKYQIRLMISYLTVFFPLFIFVVVGCELCPWIFSEQKKLIYYESLTAIVVLVAVPGILSINFFESFVLRHRWIMVFSSILSAYIVVLVDIFQILVFHFKYHWPLNTLYDVFVLCMIYMFLPIPSIRGAALLATSVSLMYIGLFIYFLKSDDEDISEVVHDLDTICVDIFHYLGFNLMGIFFRIMNDTMVRSSFLDRHQFLKEEMWLRQARQQESMLLDSILPPQIAKPIQQSIKERIMLSETDSDRIVVNARRTENFMAIQIHPDVSILYADVVNYTHLTTTLTVEKLVKVLHDLYGRFDMAASTFKVQRIKFLGDCYYCVAGLGEADPDHARMAVSLGISMIANIQEVRAHRALDIDMRIGVHSGTLLAGVIGQAKLQYDIWGPDVDIANRLEATGKPGYVHVSGRTLSSLNVAEYTVFPGTEVAQSDPILQKQPMTTYLLTAAPSRNSVRSVDAVHSYAEIDINALGASRKSPILRPTLMSDELREEFKKMPVGGFNIRSPCCRDNSNDEKVNHGLGMFCVAFKDSSLEWSYLHKPDFILKYSVLLAWGIGCCLIYIQIVNDKFTICVECIVIDMVVFTFLTSLLFISWFKKVCWWRCVENDSRKYGRVSCKLFKIWERIQHSFVLRVTIYMSIVASYYLLISTILLNCDKNQYELDVINSKLYHYDIVTDNCFNPWVFTDMISLIVGVSYTFARIPFALKMLITCCATVAYLVIVFFQYSFIFEHSATTTPFMKAELAHCLRVCMMLLTMYAKERQSEFNTKINFKINQDLQGKQKAADITNKSIIILLTNILPSHVVEVYLDSVANHELYYENYKMVSVMFAMLINFQMDLPSLRVLNDIITEFDRLLNAYKEYYVVEKIKVVGCTYMAACGLDFTLAKSKFGSRTHASYSSELEQVLYRKESKGTENDHDEVAFIMTTFALDLMRVLSVCNKAYAGRPFDRALSTGEICIGISTGEIMAGVVGASQPHYDIWGNPVNMASRMESTGLPGHIHVTQETANILEQFDIMCMYRGMTFVKGRGEIPTYFVGIDDNLKFLPSNVKKNNMSKRFSILSSLVPVHSRSTTSSEYI
uniref:adenylate cyclase n=1 Tax=Drosophila melanogaster TaxID=7227 RepID=Q9VK52_DROME|nr:adenylyl cyclase X B [Drosophila melanogaster]AAF53227.3 adenylyl cyclase X B [Drosophila melanogaster]|eukprot:NP_620474.2 ACXB [Drosophila melanogaster]